MYEIVVTRHFYGPRTERALAADFSGEIRSFDSRAEAREWIAAQEAAIYHLAHGEYMRPTYRVRKAR